MRLMAEGDLRAEDEGIDRLVVPPQVQRAPRCFRHELVGHSRCDEQLPTGGVLLHSRRDVDRITQSSEVDHRTPDIADVRDARIDRHAYLKPRPLVGAVANRFEQIDPGLDRAASILGAADTPNEESHDFIGDEFVNHRVVPKKGLCRGDVETVEQQDEVCRRAALAQRRGATNVGE
jgi:hypothetical protein